MLNYPERVAVAGIAVYAFLWLLAPLDVVFPISWPAMGYIALCYAAFFAGIALAVLMPRRMSEGRSVTYRQSEAGGFWLFALLGASGMALRIYDKLFVRGVNLAESALESREILADVEAGPLSVIGGALYPFCYIPLIIWLYNKMFVHQSRTRAIVAILLFLLPALDALLQLSRSQLLVAVSMMFASIVCVKYQGNPLNRRLILPIVAALVAIVGVSAVVFFERLDQMDLDVVFSIFDSAYGYSVTPNSAASAWLESAGWHALMAQSLLPMVQYYLHGLFEFGLLWQRPDGQLFTMGGQVFAPYVKLFSMLGVIGRDAVDYEAAYFRTGVFTTFFGPIWLDFGWFGPAFTALFGFIAKVLSWQSRDREVAVLPVYAFSVVVIFFMPVVNFFVSAQGMYAVNAFMVYWVYARYGSRLSFSGAALVKRRIV